LDKLLEELPQGARDLTREFQEMKFFNDLWVVKVATFHRNNHVGNEYLQHARRLGLEQHVMNWRKHFSTLIVSCDLSTFSQIDWAKQWASCWKKLGNLISLFLIYHSELKSF